ncbi:hypothetical protein GCM10010377_13090 [Streptomyces viridiviolaceus]|nr:hypothetical protein GCM10010377_13090 [Streptomyces viridiviolaceus]
MAGGCEACSVDLADWDREGVTDVTPWLRTVRTTGLAGILVVGATLTPCTLGTAYAAGSASPGAVASPSPSVPDDASASEPEGPEREPAATSASMSASTSRTAGRPTSGPAGSAVRDSASPSRSASLSASPSAVSVPDDESSRAGSRPGEGRQRPGRQEPWEAEEDGHAWDTRDTDADRGRGLTEGPAPAVSPGEAGLVPSASPTRSQPQADTHAEAAAEPVMKILPLGSGLVLIGLGLGLAFVALRLRRG